MIREQLAAALEQAARDIRAGKPSTFIKYYHHDPGRDHTDHWPAAKFAKSSAQRVLDGFREDAQEDAEPWYEYTHHTNWGVMVEVERAKSTITFRGPDQTTAEWEAMGGEAGWPELVDFHLEPLTAQLGNMTLSELRDEIMAKYAPPVDALEMPAKPPQAAGLPWGKVTQ